MSASETPRKPRGRLFFANPGPTNIPDSVLLATAHHSGGLRRSQSSGKSLGPAWRG